MLIDLFRRSSGDPLREFASRVRALLSAESCAIFRVEDGLPNRLRLVCESAETEYRDKKEVVIPIQSVRKKGLTGHLAKVGKVTALYGKSFRENPFRAGNPALHLKDRIDYSLLSLPLKNRKNKLIGLIKIQNKKGPNNRATASARFSKEDLIIAGTLASRLELAFESSHILTTVENLLIAQTREFETEPRLEEVLRLSLQLVRASRGDLAIFDKNRNALVITMSEGPSSTRPKMRLPRRSAIGSVWHNGQPVTITNVRSYKGPYVTLHAATRSELAVPLRHASVKDHHGRIGVLNAESFSVGAFDEGDKALLEVVADLLAKLIVGGPERSLSDASIRLAAQSDVSGSALIDYLFLVRAAYGFDSGLIYLADETTRSLLLTAQMGCDHLMVANDAYSHDMSQRTSLAANVYRRRRPLFSRTPQRDPRVFKSGLQTFRIEGPLLGVPLIYSGRILGVLMTWSRSGPRPEERHLDQLMPFATIIAAAIAKSLVEREITHVLDEAIHDLILPCGNLLDLSRQLQSGELREPRKSIALNDLRSETERILRYVQQTLQFHRHQKTVLQRTRVNLVEFLKDRINKMPNSRDIRIELRGAEQLQVKVDGHRFGSAIDNVLLNAIRYSPPHSTILVSAEASSEGCFVSIIDEGMGVPEQHRSRIFRGGVSFPPDGEAPGSGLGLAIARGAIVDHGGTLEYSPGPKGRGAVFTFFLPEVVVIDAFDKSPNEKHFVA